MNTSLQASHFHVIYLATLFIEIQNQSCTCSPILISMFLVVSLHNNFALAPFQRKFVRVRSPWAPTRVKSSYPEMSNFNYVWYKDIPTTDLYPMNSRKLEELISLNGYHADLESIPQINLQV